MLKLFLDRKGAVTVLVTLILVPVIFFDGFLVDLARFKLFQNQAVMTTDNYASAVLSEYEGVLQELYGIFSITQDEEALKALDTVKQYLGYTFDPSEGGDRDGIMPYCNAKVEIDYDPIYNSALSNPAILTTQVSDYMKYRIVQVLAEQSQDIGSVLDAVETITNAEKNIEASESYDELAKCSEKVLEKAKNYYNAFDDLMNYQIEVEELNGRIKEYNSFIDNINIDDFYCRFIEKADHENEDGTVYEEWANLEVDGQISNRLYEIQLPTYASYDTLNHEDLRVCLTKEFDYYRDRIKMVKPHFEQYASKLEKLRQEADKYIASVNDLEEKKNDLQEKLNSGEVNSAMKDTMQKRIRDLDNISSKDEIELLTSRMEDNKVIVDRHNIDYDSAITLIEGTKSGITDESSIISSDYADLLSWDNYYFCEMDKLWLRLDQMFDSKNQDKKEEEKKAESSKNYADDKKKEITKMMEDENDVPEYQIRDLPRVGGYALDSSSYSADKLDVVKLFQTIRKLFDLDTVVQGGVDLWDKYYLVCYDDGMFTSRVTNVHEDEKNEETLSGVPFSRNVDYVYGAEMEYLVGGKYETKSNLNTVRNRIITFRMLLNYMSTYSISELNASINAISDAVAVVNPLLGIAVNQSIRVVVAGNSSLYDWDELKNGNKVKLYKDKLSDMVGLNDLASGIGLNIGISDYGTNDGFGLNYRQYVQIMLLFFVDKDTLASRTGNLIMINVNHIRQGSPETLNNFNSFKINKAYTAVDVRAEGTLDFVVMPKKFAKAVCSCNCAFASASESTSFNHGYSFFKCAGVLWSVLCVCS